MKDLGQLFVVGFYGTQYNKELDELIEKYNIGGVILFKRNTPSSKIELKKMISDIYEKYESLNLKKPIITIDHEGGRVHRLNELATKFPAAMDIVEKTPKLIKKYARFQAKELKYFGINMILGPVLDLCSRSETKSPIGDRSFGEKPDKVSSFAIETMEGYESEDVIAVPKHYPGYSQLIIDPHLELPTKKKSLKDLLESDLIPFKEIIKKGAKAIMSAHMVNPSVDDRHPVTLSKKWYDILRNGLNFKGVIVSDDLCMKAIWDHYPPPKFTELGVKAGMDIFLICHQKDEFKDAFISSFNFLDNALKNDTELKKNIEKSLQRIDTLKSYLTEFTPSDEEKVFEESKKLLYQ